MYELNIGLVIRYEWMPELTVPFHFDAELLGLVVQVMEVVGVECGPEERVAVHCGVSWRPNQKRRGECSLLPGVNAWRLVKPLALTESGVSLNWKYCTISRALITISR